MNMPGLDRWLTAIPDNRLPDYDKFLDYTCQNCRAPIAEADIESENLNIQPNYEERGEWEVCHEKCPKKMA